MASVLDLIGETPLIEVTKFDSGPCRLFLKLECEAANTDLSDVFQICSSSAFGLASPPVSLKPSRPRPLPEARNESTAISESLHGIVSKVSAPEVSEWPSA